MDGFHDAGGFRNHTGDCGETVNASAMKSFEIRLNASASRTIRSGDSESNGGRCEVRMQRGHSFVAYGMDLWIC